MTDSASDDEHFPKINLKFKTTTETFPLEVDENSNISKVRRRVAKKLEISVDKVCLIFSGKILKDHETLTIHRITEGMVIHVVVRQQTRAEVQASQVSQGNSSQTQQATLNTNQSQIPGIPPELNNNFMRQIMNSPLMQQMFDNPDMIRSIFTQNPQIQQLIQSNPELGHFLNDPQILRESMEIIRNPTRLNELMRSHDQAVRNLQGIPGGEAALQRLYRDVQEPLLNSTLGSLSNNPYSTQPQSDQENSSRSQRAGVENAEALPNPWGNIVNSSRTTTVNNSQSHGNGDSSNAQPGQGFAGFMNAPGIQSLFRQISSDPNLLQNILSPENIQRFSSMFAQNPSLVQQVAPGIDQATINSMGMISNSDLTRLFTNPRVLNAFNQIRQATQVLREEAPQLFQNIPGFGVQGQTESVSSSNTSQDPQHTQSGQTQQQVPTAVPQEFMELMSQMMQLNSGSSLPPEQRFRTQLEQLTSMGFTNQQQNIEALTATFGDLSAAIERLLSNDN